MVGSGQGSVKYVAGKHADCAGSAAASIKRELPADATFDQIAAAVNELNADPPAPATSCSCRCRKALTKTPSST